MKNKCNHIEAASICCENFNRDPNMMLHFRQLIPWRSEDRRKNNIIKDKSKYTNKTISF